MNNPAIPILVMIFLCITTSFYQINNKNETKIEEKENVEYVIYSEGFQENVSDVEITWKRNKKVYMKVTAYAPHDNKSGICAENSEHPITSRGFEPGFEYAAADPSRLPYGTKLFVPNYGTVEIQDTGGALRKSKILAIDIYFPTYEEAIMWGVQYLEVEILE